MSKIDELIKEALREEDQAILEATQEKGWFALNFEQFKGKLGWVSWVIMIIQTILFFVGAWCAVQFFNTEQMLPALKWGLSAAVLIIVANQLKLSFMPQMQSVQILKELKRMELLLVRKED